LLAEGNGSFQRGQPDKKTETPFFAEGERIFQVSMTSIYRKKKSRREAILLGIYGLQSKKQ
jgi:hypothetical protein